MTNNGDGLAAALIILAGRCTSEVDSDVMIRAARVLRTTSPTRDGAEGAREDFGDMPSAYLVARLASPKPVPDAMRNLLDATRPFLTALRLDPKARELLDQIEATLSTPMPPADGAIPSRDLILSAWKIVGYDKAEKFCWAMRPDQLISALSLPDVAAEPVVVAWTIRGDDQADCNGFIPTKVVREGEFTKPLYGTPPVNGDREAFYAILTKYYTQDATLDAVWQEIKEAGLVPVISNIDAEAQACLDMLILCGDLGGCQPNETYPKYLRRLIDFVTVRAEQ